MVAVAAPSGRALAQDLWYRFYASRIAVVRLDLSHNPLETSIRVERPAVSVESVQQAAAEAGFTPDLPAVDGLPAPPVLSVLGRIEMHQTVHVARLSRGPGGRRRQRPRGPGRMGGRQAAGRDRPDRVGEVRRCGRPDRPRTSRSCRCRRSAWRCPRGFPLARLAEIVFRSGGSSWWEARRLGEEYADNPAWLFDVPADAPVTVEEIPLARGNALLVQYLDDDDDPGSMRSLVLLGRPSRLYGIVASDRELALRIAAALP